MEGYPNHNPAGFFTCKNSEQAPFLFMLATPYRIASGASRKNLRFFARKKGLHPYDYPLCFRFCHGRKCPAPI